MTRHCEALDAQYRAGIRAIEDALRTTEARSPEEFRKLTEELWRKSFEVLKQTVENQIRDFQVAVEKWSELMTQKGTKPDVGRQGRDISMASARKTRAPPRPSTRLAIFSISGGTTSSRRPSRPGSSWRACRAGKSLDQMHSQWLGALSEGLESFMRTPAFLEVLKQTLRRMVDLKLAQDQLTQSVAQQAGLPMAGTSPAFSSASHSAEQTILTRLAQLDERLKAIETKLDTTPEPKKAHGGRGKTETTTGGEDATP